MKETLLKSVSGALVMVRLINSCELRVGESTLGDAASAHVLNKDRDARWWSASRKEPLLFMGSGNLIYVPALVFAIAAWLLGVNTCFIP